MTRARDLADSADKDIAGTLTLDDITLSNDITLADNGKAIFGAGSDLQIYHSGADSFITDTGAGNLQIWGGNFRLRSSDGSEAVIDGNSGGAVTLYYDNAPKLATISTGVEITGSLGIGTTSPARTLEVYSSAPAIKLNNGTNAFTIGTGAFVDGSNSLVFFDEGVGERMRIDSSGNVGIGVVPETWNSANNGLQVGPRAAIFGTDSGYSGFSNNQYQATDGSAKYIVTAPAAIINLDPDSTIKFRQAASGTADAAISWSEAMRIDASGNLLVGKASTNIAFTGTALEAGGRQLTTTNGGACAIFNRLSSDGDIVEFRKDGSNAGSIGNIGGNLYISGASASGLFFGGTRFQPMSNGSLTDNLIDMGHPSYRFDDIYATNSTIQTSDRNEKQDIAELSDAEQRVAVAAKGLLRKFRWKDAVAEKGDEARTHFGIIAQDLQAAFAAEGLDAGDYAMFISSTWTDEETGEERTRMGVRYSELLAFIIGAL